jgi:hypothetical protein
MSWCRAQFWDFWPEIFFFKVTVLSFLGRLLWREVGSVMCQSLSLKSTRVSHYLQLFTFEFKNLHSVKHIYNNNKIYTGLVQSRLCTADYAVLTSYLVYHGSLRHLNSRTHDRRQVWAFYIFCVGPRLVQYSEHFHDFGWLLLVAWMILLCNHKRTETYLPTPW